MRDKLIKTLQDLALSDEPCVDGLFEWADGIADHLLANGVIAPPCVVGDTVYYLDDIVWDSECSDCEHYLIGGFGDPSECMRTRYGNKHPDCIKIIEKVVTQHDIYWWLYSKSFGKTVFLTKAEAERALAERRTNDD
jgi:hypothetical protein